MKTINNIYFQSGVQFHTQKVDILDDVFHRHVFYELFYITKGEIDHTVNGVTRHLVAGDMFLLRPGDSHCFMRKFEDVCEHRDVLFAIEKFKSICEFISPDFYTFINDSPTPLFAKLNQSELTDLEKDFSAYRYTPVFQLSTFAISPTNSIAVKLLYKFIQYEHSKQPKMPDWVRDLVKKMSKPESFNIETRELLDECNYNPTYAGRIFKKYMGVTIVEYFLSAKINYALSLLQFTDKPITEVAVQAGFSSLSYFNRIFKNMHGISPRDYRKSFS